MTFANLGSKRRSLGEYIGRVGLWFWVVASTVPFVFMVVTSVKGQTAALSIPPRWTFHPTGAGFAAAWSGSGASPPFSSLLLHSVILTSVITLLTTVFGVLAAYGLCFRAFRKRHFISSWILSTYMFPPIVAVVPVFFVETKLHIIGSYPGVIIPEIAFNLPIVTWLVRRGIQEIPMEIEEAALIDGATRWRVLSRIVIPLAGPVIATAAILTAILAWNEFLFAVSLTNASTETAPAALLGFTGQYGTQWGELSAASLLVTAPMVILALILRRKLIAGLTLGAIQ